MTTTPGSGSNRPERLYYRKQKLRGACWEYEISGGWLTVPTPQCERHILRHAFSFFRPREATIKTCSSVEIVQRTAAEQWFFPDRWFSLLRFTTEGDRTVGYYVNFSLPLKEVRENYYSDYDLELDLWLDLDSTITELDRDEFEEEIANARLPREWAAKVNQSASDVIAAVEACATEQGPDVEKTRDPVFGIPEFILRA